MLRIIALTFWTKQNQFWGKPLAFPSKFLLNNWQGTKLSVRLQLRGKAPGLQAEGSIPGVPSWLVSLLTSFIGKFLIEAQNILQNQYKVNTIKWPKNENKQNKNKITNFFSQALKLEPCSLLSMPCWTSLFYMFCGMITVWEPFWWLQAGRFTIWEAQQRVFRDRTLFILLISMLKSEGWWPAEGFAWMVKADWERQFSIYVNHNGLKKKLRDIR